MNWSAVKLVRQVEWTKKLTDVVIKLYDENMSQSQIASVMEKKHVAGTVTSSSIASLLGRLRRRGLIQDRPRRVKKPRPPAPPRTKHFSGRKVSPPPTAPGSVDLSNTSDVVFDVSKKCTIFDLNDRRCKWPLGGIQSVPPYEYCGCQTMPPSPYCKGHFLRGVDATRGFKRRYRSQ